jgi:hypothetical protein
MISDTLQNRPAGIVLRNTAAAETGYRNADDDNADLYPGGGSYILI